MAAQHDMSADIKLAEQNASSITLGIDGAPHDPQKLTAMLRKRGWGQAMMLKPTERHTRADQRRTEASVASSRSSARNRPSPSCACSCAA